MQPVKGKDSLGIGRGREEDTRRQMEDQNIKEFFRVLGLVSTVDLLKSIQKGENQYKHFALFANVSTINSRMRQLVHLGIIEHHLGREPKRKEWYTLTKRGERILRAIARLEKAFQEG